LRNSGEGRAPAMAVFVAQKQLSEPARQLGRNLRQVFRAAAFTRWSVPIA